MALVKTGDVGGDEFAFPASERMRTAKQYFG